MPPRRAHRAGAGQQRACGCRPSFPDPACVDDGIRGDLCELRGERFRELTDYLREDRDAGQIRRRHGRCARRNMARDPTDHGHGRGRASPAWRCQRLHQRRAGVLAGTRAGHAHRRERLHRRGPGGRPQRAAAHGRDHVRRFLLDRGRSALQQRAKVRHMFGGDFPVPLVMRVRISPASGYGSQHSTDPCGFFTSSRAGGSSRLRLPSTISA